MAIQLSVLVCIASSLAYLHLRHTLRQEAERQIATYTEQRTARERVVFEVAAQNGQRFKKELLRRMASPIPPDVDARFSAIALPWGDGTYRNKKQGFDPDTMTGVFVGPQQRIDPRFEWLTLVSYGMIDMMGATHTALFADLYITTPNNVTVLYWPGVPWTNDMPPDFDMRNEPYCKVASVESNPKREQVWTPLFYDPVGHVWMMSLATPVDVGGEHVATVGQDLLLQDFLTRIATQSMAGAHNVIFRTADETLIYAPGSEDALLAAQGKLKVRDAKDPTLARMLDLALAQANRGEVIDSGDALLSVGFIPGPDWTFITVYPKSLIDSRALAGARGIFGIGVVSLVCELVILFFVLRRAVAAPLAGLTRVASAFAGGNLSARCRIDRVDEVGLLGRAFDEMAATIQARDAELAEHAAELEKKVVDRTADLRNKTEEMRLVLDTVEQGFLTIGLDGVMSSARSRALETWLGLAPPGTSPTLPEYLSATDPETGEWLELGLESLREGLLPYELCIDQLPKKMNAREAVLEISYTPILVDGEPRSLLVVMTDVTAAVELDRLEEEKREVLAIFQHIGRDASSFTDFVEETSELVVSLREGALEPTAAKRAVHTIKGNSAVMGIDRVTSVCHEVEDAIEAEGGMVSETHVTSVASAWSTFRDRVRTLLPERRSGVEMSESEHSSFRARLVALSPPRGLVETVDSWRLEPVERRFRALADRAISTARRLGRGELQVDTRSHGIRMDAGPLARLWSSLNHLVRNAIDHGIEPEDERRSNGKSPSARLTFESLVEGPNVVLAVEDDGRGIDWEKVAAKATQRGLPASTQRDLEDALFADGLSTRDEVTDVSGRGVGMSAVLEEVKRLGGTIRIRTKERQGTRFECVVPTPSGAHAGRPRDACALRPLAG